MDLSYKEINFTKNKYKFNLYIKSIDYLSDFTF